MLRGAPIYRMLAGAPSVRAATSRAVARACPNARVCLTHADPAVTIQTKDPHDSAHAAYGLDGKLLPAARTTRDGSIERALGKPRQYPPCYITSSGAGVDSMFDPGYERERWLVDEGLMRPQPSARDTLLAAVVRMGPDALRRRIEGGGER